MNRELAMTFISRAIDGELSGRQRLQLEAWLAAHPEDGELAEQWKALGRLVRDEDAALQTPDAELAWQDIRRAMRNAKSTDAASAPPFFRWRLTWAAAMVAVVCATVLTWGVWRGHRAQVAMARASLPAPAQIEWADTEVPGASTMVYQDEASGLAVVWLLMEDKPVEEKNSG